MNSMIAGQFGHSAGIAGVVDLHTVKQFSHLAEIEF